jgi:hypothetical protein
VTLDPWEISMCTSVSFLVGFGTAMLITRHWIRQIRKALDGE